MVKKYVKIFSFLNIQSRYIIEHKVNLVHYRVINFLRLHLIRVKFDQYILYEYSSHNIILFMKNYVLLNFQLNLNPIF